MTGKGFFFCLYERNAAFLLTRPYFGNAKIGNLWGQIRAFGTQNIPSFSPKLCHFWRKTLLFMLQNMLSFRLEVRIRRAGSRHLLGKVLTATTESLNCLLPASPLLAFQGCGGCFRRVRFSISTVNISLSRFLLTDYRISSQKNRPTPPSLRNTAFSGH